MNEIDKINQAVDAFASEIKTRLAGKHDDGYRGWDETYPTIDLTKELIDDARDVRLNLPIKKFKITCTNVLNRRLVDISARAMMLWYRHK